MVSGYTDANKKFHPFRPYQKKGVRKSRDSSAKTQGVRMKRADLKVKLPKAYTPAWNKLKQQVEKKVDSDFNSYPLSNIEKINPNYTDDIVIVEPRTEDVKDFFGESSMTDKEFEKKHTESEIEDAKQELMDQQREIMWGTVFEAKDSFLAEKILKNSDEIVNDVGFTIIDMRSADGYNTGVFLAVNGAGYDFYEAHWVPLYRLFGWV